MDASDCVCSPHRTSQRKRRQCEPMDVEVKVQLSGRPCDECGFIVDGTVRCGRTWWSPGARLFVVRRRLVPVGESAASGENARRTWAAQRVSWPRGATRNQQAAWYKRSPSLSSVTNGIVSQVKARCLAAVSVASRRLVLPPAAIAHQPLDTPARPVVGSRTRCTRKESSMPRPVRRHPDRFPERRRFCELSSDAG